MGAVEVEHTVVEVGETAGMAVDRGHEQFGRGVPQKPRKRMREYNYFRCPTHTNLISERKAIEI